MKLLGINFVDEFEEGNNLDAKVLTREQLAIYLMEYKRIKNNPKLLDEILSTYDTYFTELKKLQNNNIKTDNVIIENGKVILKEGMAIHKISDKDDNDNILARMQSIADLGILPIEWFGLDYPNNEVFFRASAHHVYKTQLYSDMLIPESIFDEPTLKANNHIGFVLDLNNPVMDKIKELYLKTKEFPKYFGAKGYSSEDQEFYWMLDTDNRAKNNADEYVKTITGIINTYKDFLVSYVENCSDDMTIDTIKTEFKKARPLDYAGVYKISKQDVLRYVKTYRNDFSKNNLEEFSKLLYNEEYNRSYNNTMKKYQAEKNTTQKYTRFLLGGILPQTIIGVSLTDRLAKNDAFVEKVGSIFPNACIFNGKTSDVLIEREGKPKDVN